MLDVKDKQQWASTAMSVPLEQLGIEPMIGDASSRLFFRVKSTTSSHRYGIIMYTPQGFDAIKRFCDVAKMIYANGICTPVIKHVDIHRKLVLVSDMGSSTLMQSYRHGDLVPQLKALDLLLQCQLRMNRDATHWPIMSKDVLANEMLLFVDWYCDALLKKPLNFEEKKAFQALSDHMIHRCLSQRSVWVHRDYHARNLVCSSTGQLSIVDFQDAMIGPISYDVVSLLKDCYHDLREHDFYRLIRAYYTKAQQFGLMDIPMKTFLDDIDIMGMQRHLKCLGIFARLYIRDHKPHYLVYLPRVMNYLLDACQRHPSCARLERILRCRDIRY